MKQISLNLFLNNLISFDKHICVPKFLPLHIPLFKRIDGSSLIFYCNLTNDEKLPKFSFRRNFILSSNHLHKLLQCVISISSGTFNQIFLLSAFSCFQWRIATLAISALRQSVNPSVGLSHFCVTTIYSPLRDCVILFLSQIILLQYILLVSGLMPPKRHGHTESCITQIRLFMR